MTTLPVLREGLAWEGFDETTPGALIERGGTQHQRELRGTFAELVENGPAWVRDGPVLLLLGEAVGLGAPPAVEKRAFA
jgi:siroheme synthase